MLSRKGSFFSILIALFLLNSGCTQQRDASYDFPVDVGTLEDHAKIQQTALEIEKVAASLGKGKDFHSFPVFVVGKNTPHAMGSAYCLSDSSGHGVYIGIRRHLLEETAEMNANGFGKSRLFLILLHEYGHCLFGRAHDTELLRQPNTRINLQADPASSVFQSVVALPPTCMYPNAYITELPDSLKKYYVGELFGLGRMKSLGEAEKLEGFQLSSTLAPVPLASPTPAPAPVRELAKPATFCKGRAPYANPPSQTNTRTGPSWKTSSQQVQEGPSGQRELPALASGETQVDPDLLF